MVLLISWLMVFSSQTTAQPVSFEQSQTQAEWRLLEQRKQMLRDTGVPDREEVLNFLALELFYNVPKRPVLASVADDIKIRSLSLKLTLPDRSALSRYFPNWSVLKNVFPSELQAIKITGHSSFFVWDAKDPSRYFIWKRRGTDQIADLTRKTLKRWRDKIPEAKFDLVTEFPLGHSTARLLKTEYSRAEDQVLPLHGFLSSPFLKSVAAAYGLSPFEFLSEVLMVQYADLYFSMAYSVGLAPDSHTQNLWIVMKPDGQVHLASKDFELFLLNPLFSPKELHKQPSHFVIANAPCENGETCRLSEPSFHFAEYALQTIIHSGSYSDLERSQLMKVFFDRLRLRLEHHFEMKFNFDLELESVWKNLDQDETQKYLKRFSVHGGRRFFDRASGHFAFAERLVREINVQIYERLIGPREYPRDEAAQKRLEFAFDLTTLLSANDSESSLHYLVPDQPSPRDELEGWWRTTYFQVYEHWLKKKIYSPKRPLHFERARDLVLLVDDDQRILAVAEVNDADCAKLLTGG